MNADLVIAPLLILGLGAIAVYLFGRFAVRSNRGLAVFTAVVLAASLASVARLVPVITASTQLGWPADAQKQAAFQVEPAGLLVTLVNLGLAFVVVLYSADYMRDDDRQIYYYPLLLLLTGGMSAMLMAADLFTLYLATLLAGVSSYVLVAFRRREEESIEAGFKYLVMGSAGAMLILMGIGLLYRETGTTALARVGQATGAWASLGRALIVSGYAIKSALVPAHTWLPDAHGQAPSSISALLSGILIEVNLYIMIKVGLASGWPAASFGLVLVVLAILNMTVGNAMALRQTRVKRLLGYSSIAQVGYVLAGLGIGIADGRPAPVAAGFYLLVAHAGMKGLAFLCVGTIRSRRSPGLVTDLDGLSQQRPWVCGALALAIAALAGIPPLAGFVAKWQLAVTTLHGRSWWGTLALGWLILNSLLAFGYYVPLIGHIFRSTQGAESGNPVPPAGPRSAPILTLVSLGILSALLITVSLFPRSLWSLTDQAAQYLVNWSMRP